MRAMLLLALFLLAFTVATPSGAQQSQIDVVGVELGMPLDVASEIIMDHFGTRTFDTFYLNDSFEQPELFDQERQLDFIFRNGRMFVSGISGEGQHFNFEEMIVVFSEWYSNEERVIAVVRSLDLDSFGVSEADVQRALRDKYGQPGLANDISPSGSYMVWSADPDRNAELAASISWVGYLKLFSDNCFHWRFVDYIGLFNVGDRYFETPLWYNAENMPVGFAFLISSERYHRAGDFKRWREDSRPVWAEEHIHQVLSEMRQCGTVLSSYINGWRYQAERLRADFILYDIPTLLELSARRSRELEAGNFGTVDPSTPTIEF